MANILRGLDIAANSMAGVLGEAYQKRMAAQKQAALDARTAQEQSHELMVNRRAEIFKERMAKEREAGLRERANNTLNEQRRKNDLNAGINHEKLQELRHRNTLNRTLKGKDDFVAQMKLYDDDIANLNSAIRDARGDGFGVSNDPELEFLKTIRKDQIKARNEFGRTRGEKYGFIVPEMPIEEVDPLPSRQEWIPEEE